MIEWLQLTDEQRKASIDQAEQVSGIYAKALEKDWWVTLTLKALFQSAYRQHMVFKGGTSLSKCWNLIARLSEDIDIALSPEAFGLEYKHEPPGAYVSKLKKAGCAFTSTLLLAELQNQLHALGVPDGMLLVEAAPIPETRTDTDPQTLFVNYPSLYPKNDYIPDNVKIEVSVRSLLMPFANAPIQSLLLQMITIPGYKETPFEVTAVEPRKTFLEKIFLLHEEFSKPDKSKIRTQRMSRHLYDLFEMANKHIAEDALADHDLYDHIIQHRQWYNRITGIDYATHGHATISFIPTAEVIEEYRKDYQTMREQMIYEEAESFDGLIEGLKRLQGRLRFKNESKNFDEILDEAENDLRSSIDFISQNGGYRTTQVTYRSDQYLPHGPQNKTVSYTVTFNYDKERMIFESIAVQG